VGAFAEEFVKSMERMKCMESFRGFFIYLSDHGAEMYGLDLKCIGLLKCME